MFLGAKDFRGGVRAAQKIGAKKYFCHYLNFITADQKYVNLSPHAFQMNALV
jgi:hypothetical protein